MILYPAIDLKDGRCVRLRQGDMAQATVFNDDPAAQARAFEAAGFEWLHCVDLNGAFAGNTAAMMASYKKIKVGLILAAVLELRCYASFHIRSIDFGFKFFSVVEFMRNVQVFNLQEHLFNLTS